MQISWDHKGIDVDGRYLNNDIVLISSDINEIIEMIPDLKLASERAGLEMRMTRTKNLKQRYNSYNYR